MKTRFLLTAALLAATLYGCGTQTADNQGTNFNPQVQASVNPVGSPVLVSQDPAQALAALQAGNARYINGTNTVLVRSKDRPLELDTSQSPIVSCLCCSDSRVDPQLAFDQPWGNVFVARVAGNVAEQYMIGSIEFSVSVLGTRLIVVLGHEHCGAVDAAVGVAGGQPLPPGNLGSLVQLIVPAAQSVQGQPGDPLENATIANIQQSVRQLRSNSPVIDAAVASGKVVIVGALYTFQSGEIKFLQ